ncbi:MAG: TetR/AcrR family transcriptional regulator C-terminal domain-containing protein [Negativibacillus sp.]
MKHEATSLRTKKMFAESLKKQMKTKPFSKITVSEIIKDCGVNRKTFYYHFEDIYALLKWTLEEEAMEVVRHFDLLVDYEEAIAFVMDYVEKNDYIINCAYDSIGLDKMKQFFYADFVELIASIVDQAEKKEGVSLNPDYKRFLVQFYTEACAGMLIDWIKHRQNLDQEKMVEYLSQTFKVSLLAMLRNAR